MIKKYYPFLFIFSFIIFQCSKNLNAQYCPTFNSGGACLTNTVFNTINYTSTGCVGVPNYTATGFSTSVIQGQTYTCTVTNDGTIYGSAVVSIWIDWDQDLLYEPTEWYQPYTAALTGSSIIVVPLTAVPGPRGMRVRSRGTGFQNGAGDACLTMGSGETEDYVVNVVSATPCTGTPIAGTAVATPTTVCPGVLVNFSLNGASLTGGLAYQWLRRIPPSTAWIPMVGQTNPTMSILPPPGSVTQYRCIVTCTFTGLTDTSLPTALVTVQSWSPTSSTCWCVPTYVVSGNDDNIANVTLGTLTNNTAAALNPPPYYVNYIPQQTGPTPTLNIPNLTPGAPTTLTVSYGGNPDQHMGMWIDYNHSGAFDTTEYVTPGTNAGPSGTHVLTFTPLVTSIPGITRMRIRGGDDVQMNNNQACGPTNSISGEAEDYLVNILSAGPFDPNITSIGAPVGNLCIDSSVILTALVCNYGSNVISTTTDTVIVTFTVTGPSGPVIYKDTLPPGLTLGTFGSTCQTATVSPVNMYAGGNYYINAVVSWTGPSNSFLANDSLPTAINILNYRPTPGTPYQLCQYDNIGFGQGLTVSGCSAPIYDSITLNFTITGPCTDNVGATGAGTSFGLPANCADQFACGFGNVLMPALPPGSSFYTDGVLTVTHLSTLTTSWGDEMRMNLYGSAPVGANLYSAGINLPGIGLPSTGITNFTFTRPVSSANLSAAFSGLAPGATLNLGYWEAWNDNYLASDIATNATGLPTTATLKIYYQYVPPAFAWYDVPSGGSSLYSLSPFDPLSYTNAVVNNSNVPGSYTFYAACAGLPSCRVPVILDINPTPAAYQDSIYECEFAPGANNAIFDLSTVNGGVSGGLWPTVNVDYYGDQALLNIFPLVDTFSTTFIYSKVYYASTGCYSSDSVYLEVNTIPQFTQNVYSGLACAPSSIDISSLMSVFSLSTIDTFYYSDPLYTIPYTGNPHAISIADTLYMIAVTSNSAACADSSIAIIDVISASNYIANQNTIGNYSTPGTVPCGVINLTEGNTQTLYTTSDCRRVATVKDSVDGINLLDVTICEEIFSGVPVHNTQPYLNRSYEITPTQNGKARVCLYYLDQDFADYTAAAVVSTPNPWPPMDPTTNLCITQVDGGLLGSPGSTAISIPNLAITTSYDATTTVWTVCFPVDSFSAFYCHTCNPLNTPLPVGLLSFTGKRVGETSLLNWVTLSEQNNSHFILERSKDAKTFSAISSKINSKALNGNSNVNLEYHFTDVSPFQGHNHYRLQQVDIDGYASYSQVIDIYYGNETMVTLYPNPVSTELHVDINTLKATMAYIKITDAAGRVVRRIETSLQAGSNSTKIDLASLVDGVYMVSITNNKGLNYSQTIRKK